MDDGQTPSGFRAARTITSGTDSQHELAVLETVATATLAGITEQFPGKPIGILKLDIEGGECDLLRGAQADLHAVPIILAELHDRMVKGCTEAFYEFSEGRWVISTGGEKLLSLAKGPPSALLQ